MIILFEFFFCSNSVSFNSEANLFFMYPLLSRQIYCYIPFYATEDVIISLVNNYYLNHIYVFNLPGWGSSFDIIVPKLNSIFLINFAWFSPFECWTNAFPHGLGPSPFKFQHYAKVFFFKYWKISFFILDSIILCLLLWNSMTNKLHAISFSIKWRSANTMCS